MGAVQPVSGGETRYVLGLDLALLTGWALWDAEGDCLVRSGSIDVRKVEGDQARMGRWRDHFLDVLDMVPMPEVVGFEEVRRVPKGLGALNIWRQEGIVLSETHSLGMLCQGVNVATVKRYARDVCGHPKGTITDATAMRAWLCARVGLSVGDITEDEAVAAWVARWVGEAVVDAP